ncbi:ATP-binding protein [Collinsella intestinalis]|uniref:ATP-binding protein n=1 Tax=Collinsella intestinalis TaxID=147207 RepID=UPI0022E83496|nr:ATP-binding protein [Collinsella intestinalis]
MSEDFYPFVDSGDPAPDNTHLVGGSAAATAADAVENTPNQVSYTIRISVYDDMLSTPRVIVVEQSDVRTYLEDVTNTVYRTMKEQGGKLSLMIIRELVENFIHAQFSEPVISILDNGNTIRFADQGPGIGDKERAFEFGVTSADREKKRYIRGTGAGLPMVQQYVENAGGAIAVEDNLGAGTVVTVSVDPKRAAELEHAVSRGAAVRSGCAHEAEPTAAGMQSPTDPWGAGTYQAGTYPAQTGYPQQPYGAGAYPGQMPYGMMAGQMPGAPGAFPQQPAYYPGYQQGYPMQGFQQHQGFPQPGFPQAGAASQGYAQIAPAPAQQGPYVSERGAAALLFIYQNGKGGPTDLTRALGRSDATWSRELDALASTGLVHKPRQKYVLTDMGKAWVEQSTGAQ